MRSRSSAFGRQFTQAFVDIEEARLLTHDLHLELPIRVKSEITLNREVLGGAQLSHKLLPVKPH